MSLISPLVFPSINLFGIRSTFGIFLIVLFRSVRCLRNVLSLISPLVFPSINLFGIRSTLGIFLIVLFRSVRRLRNILILIGSLVLLWDFLPGIVHMGF